MPKRDIRAIDCPIADLPSPIKRPHVIDLGNSRKIADDLRKALQDAAAQPGAPVTLPGGKVTKRFTVTARELVIMQDGQCTINLPQGSVIHVGNGCTHVAPAGETKTTLTKFRAQQAERDKASALRGYELLTAEVLSDWSSLGANSGIASPGGSSYTGANIANSAAHGAQSGGGGFPVAPEPTDSFILNAADTDEVLWPIPAAPDSAVTSVAAPGGEMTEEEFSSFLAFLEALPPYGDCAAGELGSDAMDIGGVLWPTPAAPDSAVTSVAAPGGYCLSEMTNPWQSLGVCVGGDLSGQDGDEEFIPLLDEFLGYL